MRSCAALLLVLSLLSACDGAAIVSRPRADASADVFDVARPSGDAAPRDVVGDAAALDADADGPPVVGDTPDAVSGWVAGSVFHADLGDPLMGARVTVDGAPGPTSDADGLFSVTLPRGVHVFTVSLAGHLPARVEVVVGHAPTALRVPLMPVAAAQPVGPTGATLSLGDHGEVVFPPDAVPTTAMVSATWVPAHALEAVVVPAAVDTGAGGWVVPRGALVVSDLLLDRAARVRLRRPADLTADQCELRGLRDDGAYAERFDPVAHGGGLVEFDVAHFSTYVLVEKRGPSPSSADCDAPSPAMWASSTRSIVRDGAPLEAPPLSARAQFEVRCGDGSNADNAEVVGEHGTLTASTSARFTLSHGQFWRATFNRPLTGAAEQIKLRVNPSGRMGLTLPHDTGVWDIVYHTSAALTVRASLCSNGARGYAFQHAGSIHSGPRRRDAARRRGRGGGARHGVEGVPPGSAAPAALPVAAPQCLTPEGCAAGLRCDAAARRCVASMGGACTGDADCDVGLACAGGRCARSPMPAPGARQACRTDADCPDQRCDRTSGACGGFTTNGQRACALTRECPQDYAPASAARAAPRARTSARAPATAPPRMSVGCPAASRPRPRAAPTRASARRDYGCVDGRCVLLVVCAPDQTLCSNRCVSPSSTSYCVACGQVSHERPNATATCGNRGLRLSCRGMFGDCDGNAENGCEALLFSNAHCGRCGMACASGQTCDGGRCGTVARSTVVQVALGRAHGCARYANGRVRCWGAGPGGPPPGRHPPRARRPKTSGSTGSRRSSAAATTHAPCATTAASGAGAGTTSVSSATAPPSTAPRRCSCAAACSRSPRATSSPAFAGPTPRSSAGAPTRRASSAPCRTPTAAWARCR
ncbi:MAG: hypothetical protein U0325_01855 [Polyangiales bacterium]